MQDVELTCMAVGVIWGGGEEIGVDDAGGVV